MFGFDCSSTCGRQDEKTSTVKVDMEAMSRQRDEEVARRQAEEEQARLCQQEEAARLEQMEEEAKRLQREHKLREQAEAEERTRAEAERRNRERQAEQERQEQRRRAEEAAKQRAEQERLETEEREKEVSEFLKQYGFAGVNSKKSSFMSSTYALHKAAELNDVKIVAMLIKSGADPSQKNSSGKTAAMVAEKKDKKGSHSAVLSVLSQIGVSAPSTLGGC